MGSFSVYLTYVYQTEMSMYYFGVPHVFSWNERVLGIIFAQNVLVIRVVYK